MIKLALYPEILKSTNEIACISSHITRLHYNEYRYKHCLKIKILPGVEELMSAFHWGDTKFDSIFWYDLDQDNTYENIHNFKIHFLFKPKLYYYD